MQLAHNSILCLANIPTKGEFIAETEKSMFLMHMDFSVRHFNIFLPGSTIPCMPVPARPCMALATVS